MKKRNKKLQAACPDFLSFAKARKTTLDFTSRGIRNADLLKILEAGRWAPSPHNIQTWSFIVVKNKKTIDKLMSSCHYGDFHSSPALIIAFVLEPLPEHKAGLLKGTASEITGYNRYLSLSLPALIMAYEAQAIGIGSCMLSPVMKQANKTLGVASGRAVPLLLGLGYEVTGAPLHRTRKPLGELVKQERYEKRRR